MLSKFPRSCSLNMYLNQGPILMTASLHSTNFIRPTTKYWTFKSPLYSCKFNFSTQKTDSPWIYSNIFEQFRKTPKGKVILCWHPYSKNNKFSIHDISLRMKNQLDQAHIIITQSIDKTKQMLVALKQKQKYYYEMHERNEFQQGSEAKTQSIDQSQQVNKTKSIQKVKEPTSLVYKQQENFKQLYQLHIEMSKHLMIQSESQEIKQNHQKKSRSDGRHRKAVSPQFMKKMTDDQAKLKQYMISKHFKQNLQAYKSKEGHAPLFNLQDITGKINLYYNIGLRMVFVLQSFDIEKNKHIMEQLQGFQQNKMKQNVKSSDQDMHEEGSFNKKKIAYEILPIEDPTISSLALAGFPADRFSVQKIAKNQNFKLIFKNRKKQRCAVSIQVQGSSLLKLVQDIIDVYGKQQLVFMQISDENHFRGQAFQFIQFLYSQYLDKTLSYCIVVAPYLPDFNEKLEGAIKEKKHIIGKMVAKQTHFVQLEYLGQQMAELEKKDNRHSVSLSALAQQLVIKFGMEKTVEILGRLLPKLQINCQNQEKLKRSIVKLVNKAAQNITEDYIGIGEFTQRSKQNKMHKQLL